MEVGDRRRAPGRGRKLIDLPAVFPEVAADSVVIFRPRATHHMEPPVPYEREIQGDVVRIEKGVAPRTIVHPAHTILSELTAGRPVKLSLRRIPDRDAYSIIVIDHRVSETRP